MNSLGQIRFFFSEMAKYLLSSIFLAKFVDNYMHLYTYICVYIYIYSVQRLCLEACFAGKGGCPGQPETH